MSFPEPFATNIRTVFDGGAEWLEKLPELQQDIATEWGLTLEEPPWPLSYNWVAPGRLADGTPAVLKLGVPNSERTAEIETLQLWNGQGCARLLKADTDRGAMLVERIAPGTMLCDVLGDDEQTRIAAEVFLRVRHPAPENSAFPTVTQWASALGKLRPTFQSGTGPFPPELVDAAQGLYRELLSSQGPPVLLHGDLHHFNILLDKERGWLAIDPQGVIGEAEYECGALLRNYELSKRSRAEIKRITARRIDILSETLGFDKDRLIGWGLAQAILSAWWDWHDGVGPNWTSSMFMLADVLKELQT